MSIDSHVVLYLLQKVSDSLSIIHFKNIAIIPSIARTVQYREISKTWATRGDIHVSLGSPELGLGRKHCMMSVCLS